MGIQEVVGSTLVQTAVYWGNPVDDGYGGFTWDAPVEIECRWEGKVQIAKAWDAKGTDVEYIGVVFVDQDLDEEGCLFLGTLDDLEAGADTQPLSMEDVYKIKQFEKIPILRSTSSFIRRAYLTQWQYR